MLSSLYNSSSAFPLLFTYLSPFLSDHNSCIVFSTRCTSTSLLQKCKSVLLYVLNSLAFLKHGFLLLWNNPKTYLSSCEWYLVYHSPLGVKVLVYAHHTETNSIHRHISSRGGIQINLRCHQQLSLISITFNISYSCVRLPISVIKRQQMFPCMIMARRLLSVQRN